MNELQSSPIARKWLKSAWPLAIAMILMLSCSIFSSPATNTPAPTNTPVPTDTQAPSDTPEPTATKKATPNRAATQAAQQEAEQQETDAAATEFAGAVLGEVQSKLDEVGEMMGSGSVIWLYPSAVPMVSSKPNVIYYNLLDPSIQAGDFAFHSNIKWETKGNAGIVNCVIMFRVGKDVNMDPWYSLRLSRISGGSSARFDLWQNWAIIGPGQWGASNYIRDGNGDQNEVIVVAKANQFTVYVNGKQVNVWWNSRLTNGGFGLGTLQDYGTTTCTYSDNWIWAWS